MHRRDMSDPGAHWLAAAHPHPSQVWDEWDDARAVALLPAGVRWDAVAMPQRRMQAVAEDLGPHTLAQCPVLVDLSVERVYVLVPPGTAQAWATTQLDDGITVISEVSWLVAPRPLGIQSQAGTWAVAPGPCPRLADPAALLDSLHRTAATCGAPCPAPDHRHVCTRTRLHCGVHRDAKTQGNETCSWTHKGAL